MAKKCRVCKERFEPFNSLQFACSTKCAISWGKSDVEKKERKENKEAKAKLKSRGEHIKEAQTIFNKWIRTVRDAGNSCISCGRSTGCKVNAGHYRSVGSSPELRFNEDNVHLQCEHCNCHKSGNCTDYRIRLIQKIGLARVEKLEGPHKPKKYTIEEIKEIKEIYRMKIKQQKEI